MKKVIYLSLIIIMALVFVVGCGKKEEGNDNTKSNNKGACEVFKGMSGFTVTSICWCRNDFSISDNQLTELKSKGYNYNKSDFIYCNSSTTEDTGTGMGKTLEGYILKACALELGWPKDSYSNEGGYTCY